MKLYDTNNTVNASQMGFALFHLKTLLLSAGWIVTSSGDGLAAYSAVGDIITSDGAGVGGMGNANAWIRLQQPAGGAAPYSGVRELVYQNGALLGTSIRAKYSYSDGFVGGAPSAIQTPSATDEVFYLGGGTDAAPTFFAFGFAAGRRFNAMADDASPFGFYMFSFPAGGGPSGGIIAMDPIESGTFPYGTAGRQDIDPNIFLLSSDAGLTSAVFTQRVLPDGQGGRCFMRKGYAMAGNIFGGICIPTITGNGTTPAFPATGAGDGVGPNPYNGDVNTHPCSYENINQGSTFCGTKGVSSFVEWVGSDKATGDTLNLALATSQIIVDQVALPWPTGVVPLV